MIRGLFNSLSGKLTLLMVVTSGVSLLVAGVALVATSVNMNRKLRATQLASTAQVLASNSNVAISFRQTATCEEYLAGLAHQPSVTYACMLDEEGAIIASYQAKGAAAHSPPPDRQDGVHFTGGFIDVQWPAFDGDERIGSVYVRASLRDLHEQTWLIGQTAALVMLIGFLLATLLSLRLQRIVSSPILALAKAARRVSDDGDLTIRVHSKSDDEIGSLCEQFNNMLERIQASDAALRAVHAELREANDQLEARVQQRTKDLQHEMLEHQRVYQELHRSEHRERAIVESGSDGILTFDENGRIESFNTAAEEIFGCLAEEAIGRQLQRFIVPTHVGESPLVDVFAGRSRRIEVQGRRHDGSLVPLELSTNDVMLGDHRLLIAFVRDLTERKRAEQTLAELHGELLETSRKAGMADVANSVLHNVGNVLNSVNISAALVCDRMRALRINGLTSAVTLLQSHAADLPELMREERGQRLPSYLDKLAQHLETERTGLVDEVRSLIKNVDHIKDIVRAQQNYTGVSGVMEAVQLDRMMDDALQFARGSFERYGIEVVRDYDQLPAVNVEKSKLLQILVNLIKNAKEAMVATEQLEKLLTLRVKSTGERVRLEVTDNGPGIAPENVTAIFSHGFTTKKHGHGFGLHSSANAAAEMSGSLTVRSDGLGHGATFIVELPMRA